MVNSSNRIEGRSISTHPYADKASGFIKHAPVLAAQAPIGGVISTPEGEMRFQAGDWILTDIPVTHAWPVQDQVFRLTYVPDEPKVAEAKAPVVAKKPVVRRKKPVRRVVKPKPAEVADSKSLEALI